MRIFVDDQLVPEIHVRDALQWISHDPRWQAIRDPKERAQRQLATAQQAAIDRVLMERAAARDPRSVDGRGAFDDTHLRQMVELGLRVHRLRTEMSEVSAEPTSEEVESFYKENRQNFRRPDTFHAAHIVKEVNGLQTAEQAESGIRVALAELERGEEFTEAADRHSDCKGNGGDLGRFKAGSMVEDFENAIRALEPGQRSGIFTTRFGYHIAKLYSRSAGEVMAFDEVRSDIEGYFRARSREQLVMAGVAKMRAGW